MQGPWRATNAASLMPGARPTTSCPLRPALAPPADGSGGAFVLTPTVQGHLRNLARAVLLRRYPILLQARTAGGTAPPSMLASIGRGQHTTMHAVAMQGVAGDRLLCA